MAGRGPAPQTQHQRERDTKRRQAGGAVLKVDGRARGPKLPPGHQEQTVAWYEALRQSPQATQWLPVDWQHLQMVAFLVDRWVLGGFKALDWQEVRLNLANYGLTPADRLRLKWTVETEKADGPLAAVTTLNPRAAALARLNGETP